MMKVLTGFIRLLSPLPLWFLYRFSDLLFPLIYHLARYRRKVVRKNLVNSFPEMTKQEIRTTERTFYRFFCDLMMETVRQLTISTEEMNRRVTFSGEELMLDTLRNGKSVFLMMGHYCNWEWVLSGSGYMPDGVGTYPIYQRLNNPDFEKLMLQIRGNLGGQCIEKDNLVRTIFKLRNEGKCGMFAMISDQSPMKKFIRYRMNFLNQDTPVFLGTEQLARKYDYPVFYMDMKRIRRGYYHCEVKTVTLQPQEEPEYEITTRFMRLLEDSIRRNPAFWLWTHNRWKHSNSSEQ